MTKKTLKGIYKADTSQTEKKLKEVNPPPKPKPKVKKKKKVTPISKTFTTAPPVPEPGSPEFDKDLEGALGPQAKKKTKKLKKQLYG